MQNKTLATDKARKPTLAIAILEYYAKINLVPKLVKVPMYQYLLMNKKGLQQIPPLLHSRCSADATELMELVNEYGTFFALGNYKWLRE